MMSVRRWAILPVLALLIAAMAGVALPLAGASAAPQQHTPPVLADIETTPLIYQWIGLPIAVTSALTVSDNDDATMSGATVSITSGFDPANDWLSIPGSTRASPAARTRAPGC